MQTPNVNTASVPKKINKQLNAINKQIDIQINFVKMVPAFS